MCAGRMEGDAAETRLPSAQEIGADRKGNWRKVVARRPPGGGGGLSGVGPCVADSPSGTVPFTVILYMLYVVFLVHSFQLTITQSVLGVISKFSPAPLGHSSEFIFADFTDFTDRQNVSNSTWVYI